MDKQQTFMFKTVMGCLQISSQFQQFFGPFVFSFPFDCEPSFYGSEKWNVFAFSRKTELDCRNLISQEMYLYFSWTMDSNLSIFCWFTLNIRVEPVNTYLISVPTATKWTPFIVLSAQFSPHTDLNTRSLTQLIFLTMIMITSDSVYRYSMSRRWFLNITWPPGKYTSR